MIDTVHASLHDRTAIADAYEHVLIAFGNEECDHITIELMMSAGNEVEGEVQRKYATIYDGKTWQFPVRYDGIDPDSDTIRFNDGDDIPVYVVRKLAATKNFLKKKNPVDIVHRACMFGPRRKHGRPTNDDHHQNQP